MSFYSLAGLDLPSLQQLFQRVPSIHTKSTNQAIVSCSLCRKARREELLILIDHTLAVSTDDVILICSRCRLGEEGKEGKPRNALKFKHLKGALKAILDQQFCREGIPILNRLIGSITKAIPTANKRYDPAVLIKHLVYKFLGESKDDSETGELSILSRRTCELIRQFYVELKRSDIARFYHSLFNSQIRIDSALINFLRVFCQRERTFKLDVLQRMAMLAYQTRDARDLSKWMRRGAEGLQRFSTAFAATPRNLKNTLFSIARTEIQFRYVYDENQKEAECELLATEFPFTTRPNFFRITSFGFEDEVEIGLYFAKRNLEEGLLPGCVPLLYRFRVGCGKESTEAKRAVSAECRHRMDRDSKSYSKGKIVDKEEPKGRGRRPIFSIEDEDQLQLTLDYFSERLRIYNRTQDHQIYEAPIKTGYTAKYFIFPCVRLIGTRTMVESLPE